MNSEPVASNNANSSANSNTNKNALELNYSSLQENKGEISEKDLQLLAEKIYKHLRKYLFIELERKHGFAPAFSLWSNTNQNINYTGFNRAINSLYSERNLPRANEDFFNSESEEINELTETLTRQIYILLLERIRSDKERSRIRSNFLD